MQNIIMNGLDRFIKHQILQFEDAKEDSRSLCWFNSTHFLQGGNSTKDGSVWFKNGKKS